jgi:hypothetical protein
MAGRKWNQLKARMRSAAKGSPEFGHGNRYKAPLTHFEINYDQSIHSEIFNAGKEAFQFRLIPKNDGIKLSEAAVSVDLQEGMKICSNREKPETGCQHSNALVRFGNNTYKMNSKFKAGKRKWWFEESVLQTT